MPSQIYDRIGADYARFRRADPRIAAAILHALGDARSVVNIGAGTGSYEPSDRVVVAVEPSAAMVANRSPDSAPVVRAYAAALPFRRKSFDAALAVLTVHHWSDWRVGLEEMLRVANHRVVIFTWDPAVGGFWLLRDYFPEILAGDRERFPPISALTHALADAEAIPVAVPWDCSDGFIGAYWRRPEAYLHADVRAVMSSLGRIAYDDEALTRLRHDLTDGTWHRNHGDLLRHGAMDLGYRLIVGRL